MTNILILTFQLLFTAPTNGFTGYYGGEQNPILYETPSWYVSASICWTATMEFEAPAGVYEIWWDYDPMLPSDCSSNGCYGMNPIRIDDRIVHPGGRATVVFPVVPEPNGFFRLKKHEA